MSHPLEECSFLLLLSFMVLQPGTVEGWREKWGRGRDREGRSGGRRETEKGEVGEGGEGGGRGRDREKVKGEGQGEKKQKERERKKGRK